LRRLTLPPATNENLYRLLSLQVESEFPVPPDELAWGYRPLALDTQSSGSNQAQHTAGPGGSAASTPPGTGAKQEFLVAAVKKEAVEDYADILSKCGFTPVFTLAALARSDLCPQLPGACAVLDIGRNHSELISFENGVPTVLRVLAWGGESITRALEDRLGINRVEAEKLKLTLTQAPLLQRAPDPKVADALADALDALAAAINGHRAGQKIYLTGRTTRHPNFASGLAERLGAGVECLRLEDSPGEGLSAAILGLRRAAENGGPCPRLAMQVKPTNGTATLARPAPWKWVALAAALALGSLLLPYAEALVMKPYLAKKLVALKADRGRLATIDRELNFLQYLKSNQPPCLDTLYLLAKAAPPGARFDSLSLSRRGDLSWRGTMKDSQQVTDFRSKLIDSGLFANVSVEEQTPSPDRQKLTVRMSAQWKPFSFRQALALGPTPEEIEKAKNAPKELTMGGAGMPAGFPGMPAGPPPGVPIMPSPRKAPARAPKPDMPPGAIPVMPGPNQ
jgi:hypothetical protein